MHSSFNNSACHTALVTSSPSVLSASLLKIGNDGYDNLSPYSVVIGREKACRNAMGNKRLNALASKVLSRYTDATSRKEKSEIVSYLVEAVHAAGGNFVRFVDGQFKVASRAASREKVGVVLRDLASDQYRSSTKSKVIARRQRVQEQKVEDEPKKLEEETVPILPTKIFSNDFCISALGEDTPLPFLGESKDSVTSLFSFADLPWMFDAENQESELCW